MLRRAAPPRACRAPPRPHVAPPRMRVSLPAPPSLPRRSSSTLQRPVSVRVPQMPNRAMRPYTSSSLPPSSMPSASTIGKDLANSTMTQKVVYYAKLGWRAVVELAKNTRAANQIKKRIKYERRGVCICFLLIFFFFLFFSEMERRFHVESIASGNLTGRILCAQCLSSWCGRSLSWAS